MCMLHNVCVLPCECDILTLILLLFFFFYAIDAALGGSIKKVDE